jgi:hypothetical protein
VNTSTVYESLRQEILDTYNRQVNLVTFAFTAAAALMGFGFTAKDATSLVFLLPLVLMALLMVQLDNSIYNILTLSVYIRVVLERQNDMPKWETDIGNLREHLRDTKSEAPKLLKPFNPVTLFDSLVFAASAAAMGVICIVLSFSFAHFCFERWVSFVAAAGWIITCVILLRPVLFANSGEYERKLASTLKGETPAGSPDSPVAK